jgi:hypothetical protein
MPRASLRLLFFVALFSLVITHPAAAARRTATGYGTAWFVATAGGNGSPGAILPVPLPMQVMLIADYTSTYDSWARASRVSITRIDQSTLVRNVNINLPCKVAAGVTTTVYSNRTTVLQTLGAYTPGSSPGWYWTDPSSRVFGFVYSRTITAMNPRLVSTGAAGASNCTAYGRVTATLDLP